MSDRILVMRNNRFVAEFDREEATEEKVILAATGLAERAKRGDGGG
jgi:ABC-type sugar transport system ATPase subunit